LLNELKKLGDGNNPNDFKDLSEQNRARQDFFPQLEIRDGSFSHDSDELFKLKNITLSISPGEFIGIVGPSGGGKTTLMDILTGILDLDKGRASISGLSPSEAILCWPNEIRYVPQDVHLIAGTLRMNICWPNLELLTSDTEIWDILESVGLKAWVKSLPNELSAKVDTFGSNLSGGQKQRIGIARALFTKPHILLMDEATSSLDSSTEQMIESNVIVNLKGVTRVIVAHRLSTIIKADRIYYVSNGEILATGNFEDIRRQVPDFDRQAVINGL
jgi:ABC-type bacteriocin/lantibiotic exporter with double-glycine peptidase domain